MHIKEENFSFLALKTFLIALQKCPNFSKKQDAFLKKLPPPPLFNALGVKFGRFFFDGSPNHNQLVN